MQAVAGGIKLPPLFKNRLLSFSLNCFVDPVFLQSNPISALTMFNKCLIGWVHESQSNLAFPPLSVY